MSRKERRAAAAKARHGGDSSGSLGATFAQAVRHHELGEHLAAEATCRAILAREPKHVGSLQLLGTLAQQSGRLDEAAACFGELTKIKPDMTVAHHSLAKTLVAMGRDQDAVAALERALAIKSGPGSMPPADQAVTLFNLGYLYERLGHADMAVGAYERALAVKPDFAEALNNLGALRLAQGRPQEASAAFARALSLAPEALANFADIKPILLRIHPGLGEAIERADAAWPQHLPIAEVLPVIAPVAGDPLLQFVLESDSIIDMPTERFLTSARAAILDQAVNHGGNVEADLLQFACALAQQCFIEEYVYSDTAQELEQVEQLKAALVDALRAGSSVPPLWLAALASYGPLDAAAADLLLAQAWPAPVDKVLTQQIREPRQEQELREKLPRLTPIADETSQRVREQYEQNPYPRWVLPPSPPAALSVNQFVAAEFPGVPFRPLDDRNGIDILVAGCGTGHHPIATARRYSGVRILAVDLSLASLGYAVRKTYEFGVRNIEYGQADILSLPSLGRTFDMVDASGVLHHLGDPMAGWRRLCEVTRPGGLMRIGLYSERGRAAVVAARSFTSASRYQATPADIRRCRQELMSTPMRSLAASHDFYCTSECRDLMFHVEEHRVGLTQIAEFLAAQNLRLIGFELDASTRQAYRAQFPGDPAMTNLHFWNGFEGQRPSTFSGMYQFWCQRT